MEYKLALMVIIASTMMVSPAFAQVSTGANPPITVTVTPNEISFGEIVEITGQVVNLKSGVPVTLLVTGPQGNIITVNQLEVNQDNTFSITLNTSGSAWNYDGRYVVNVQYGSGATNKAYIDLAGGQSANPVGRPDTSEDTMMIECGAGEMSTGTACIDYTITGGSVVSASTMYAEQGGNSLKVMINATDDGTLTLSPNAPACGDTDYIVLVDGQDWDDMSVVGDRLIVNFFAGNSVIEVVGACVIPEFGGIASVILILAIVAVVVASARGKIGIMPKY